jgi:hypothetical protein
MILVQNNSPDESYFYVDASEEVSIYDYDTGGFTYMYPSEFGECALSIIDSTITAGGEKPVGLINIDTMSHIRHVML